MGNFVEDKNLGITRAAPYDVYFDEHNIFQPDIVYLSLKNISLVQNNGLHGAPDLIVEILSPSTAVYDKLNKKLVYEQYGVSEYQLIDPFTKEVEGYQLINQKYLKPEITQGSFYSPLLQQQFVF